MTTEEIITNVLEGHTEGFEKLISDNNELLYRIGMSYINNHTEVEDLMQSTYLKAFEKLSSFNNKSAFSTWITRIMINECLMLLRSKKKRKEIYYDDHNFLNSSEPVDDYSAETNLNYKELKAISEKIIFNLPEEYRIVFILRQVQKLSTKDVAEAIGISEENVKIRMFRARRMIQKMLLNYIGEDNIFSYDKKFCRILTQRVMANILKRKL